MRRAARRGSGRTASLVAIGNIHGQGELLLEHLAELPADESDDPARYRREPGESSWQDAPAVPEHIETVQLYAPRIDPYQQYPEAYETRYTPPPHIPVSARGPPAPGYQDPQRPREAWPAVTQHQPVQPAEQTNPRPVRTAHPARTSRRRPRSSGTAAQENHVDPHRPHPRDRRDRHRPGAACSP